MTEPRILLLDIENSPNLSYTWGIWKQNVIKVVEHWYLLTFSAKWFGEREFITKALPDYRGYKKNIHSDEAMVKEIWHLLDRAEIVVAHNADRHDIGKLVARFHHYHLPPPSPYKVIDTLKHSRKFKENSNKLDYLAQEWDLGSKLDHEGFALWEGCINGDLKAFERMKKYNKQDVALLEEVYKELRPWMKNHPNLAIYNEGRGCPKCGSQKLESRGIQRNTTTAYKRIFCQTCRGWSRGVLIPQEIKPLVSI